jgi:hypothetical protein
MGENIDSYGVRRAVILGGVTPVNNCDKLKLAR